MAYVSSTNDIPAGRPAVRKGAFATAIQAIREGFRSRAVYNQTVRELNELNDRELADIGLSRSTINRAALVAAYGL